MEQNGVKSRKTFLCVLNSHVVWEVGRSVQTSWTFNEALIPFSSDRSLSSSLWNNEASFLGQMTSLTSTFAPTPRTHHLPPYSTQPPPYSSSYLSSLMPPPLNHSGPFQTSSFYYRSNQPFQPAGEDRNVITALTNYIEGACLTMRGEEPVWGPY